MLIIKILGGILGAIVAITIAITVTSLTQLGWWAFFGTLLLQGVAIWVFRDGINPDILAQLSKRYKLADLGQMLLKFGSLIIAANLLKIVLTAFGVMTNWTTLNLAILIWFGFRIYTQWRKGKLSPADLAMQSVLLIGVAACLTYTSIPYQAIGDYFVGRSDGNTPYFLSVLGFFGPLQPVVEVIVASAKWVTILIFAISTTLQVSSWLYAKKIKDTNLRNALIFFAGLAYILEMLLAYRQYPFILSGGSPLSIADLLARLGGTIDTYGGITETTFSGIALLQCLISVLMLDALLTQFFGMEGKVPTATAGGKSNPKSAGTPHRGTRARPQGNPPQQSHPRPRPNPGPRTDPQFVDEL